MTASSPSGFSIGKSHMSKVIGVRNNNTIVPYVGATKATKWLAVEAAVSSDLTTSNTRRAQVRFDADSSGQWRMEYNFFFTGSQSKADNTSVIITVAGIVLKNNSYFGGTGGCLMNAGADGLPCAMLGTENTGTFTVTNISGGTATVTSLTVSGFALLNAEPTWASLGTTAAAALEGVTAVDVYIAPASATAAGLVDTSAQSFAGNKTLTGFTSLGGDVALKCKKLTGTSAAAENGSVNIAHGLTSTKIVGSSCTLLYNATDGVGPEWAEVAGYQYHVSFSSSNFIVKNHATNSENILSKSVIILVWYTE